MIRTLPHCPAAQEAMVIIAHPDSEVASLTERQITEIYMGRNMRLPDGKTAIPLDQDIQSTIRSDFYRQLVNKSVSEINAYWARLLFTGRASPPRPLTDSQEVIDTVSENRTAIGYIYAKDVTDSVKVIAQIGTSD